MIPREEVSHGQAPAQLVVIHVRTPSQTNTRTTSVQRPLAQILLLVSAYDSAWVISPDGG